MIFSSINQEIKHYPQAIQKAITYLREHDFTKMDPGIYEIEGKDIYAQVFDAMTGPVEEKRPEVHTHFLDLQYLASGKERLGFTVDTGNYVVAEQIKERDLIFYNEVENEGFIEAVPGCICVFFPFDVHRPAVASGEPMKIRKVVIKIRTTLL